MKPTATEHARSRPRRSVIFSLLAVGAVAALCFVLLAVYASSGGLHELDARLLLSLRTPGDPTNPIGPRWFEEFVRDLTALGSVGVLALTSAGVAGYLVCIDRSRTAVYLIVSVLAGAALSFSLKAGFDRTRPDLVPHSVQVYSKSFPSGHSMLAAVTYITLGAIFASVQPRRSARVYVLTLAVTLSAAIGLSRVYLGVHWPSDVAGGFALGVAWASLAWWIEKQLQRRGSIEPDPNS